MLFDKNAQRIAAIDWLRGIVMILMALDHTSWFFNEQRIFADSVLLYEPEVQFAVDQFFTRWITHICAPTFVFLAGTSIAISNFQRRQQDISDAVIDRELLLRGAFIALLDICIFSLVSGEMVLQVLYAIGVSMMLMVYLQRLGIYMVFLLAIIVIIGSECLLMALWQPDDVVPVWLGLSFVPIFGETFTVLYPVLPWLAIMMLGWVFGEQFMSKQIDPNVAIRLLVTIGWFMLALFVIIRGLDGYGNMFMALQGNTLVQWLHVSKYPPSIAYILLELGLMVMILALLMRWEAAKNMINLNGPILVFGQTALFFYLAHFCVLAALRFVIGRGDLEQTYWITLLVLIILYPICRAYRSVKWHHPQSLLRFL